MVLSLHPIVWSSVPRSRIAAPAGLSIIVADEPGPSVVRNGSVGGATAAATRRCSRDRGSHDERGGSPSTGQRLQGGARGYSKCPNASVSFAVEVAPVVVELR
jgi:hypothetical protein